MVEVGGRGYFQRRIREEIARCARVRDVFSLLERRLRACDIVVAVCEDTIAVMLGGTGSGGLRDAEQRVRAALASIGGAWRLSAFSYPEHTEAIESLDLLAAA